MVKTLPSASPKVRSNTVSYYEPKLRHRKRRRETEGAPDGACLAGTPGPAAAAVQEQLRRLACPDLELRRRLRLSHAKRPTLRQGDDHLQELGCGEMSRIQRHV